MCNVQWLIVECVWVCVSVGRPCSVLVESSCSCVVLVVVVVVESECDMGSM